MSGKYKKLIVNEGLLNFPWVEKEFRVIDTETRIVVVDPHLAEKLRLEHIDWRKLQKVSVQIAKYKLDELRMPMLAENIYGWNLDYNNFLGYMAGIIKLKKFEGEVMII